MSYWNRRAVLWFDVMPFQAVSCNYLRNSTTTYNHNFITCLWEVILIITLIVLPKSSTWKKNDKKILQMVFLTILCTISSKRLIKHLTQRKREERRLLAREGLKRGKCATHYVTFTLDS